MREIGLCKPILAWDARERSWFRVEPEDLEAGACVKSMGLHCKNGGKMRFFSMSIKISKEGGQGIEAQKFATKLYWSLFFLNCYYSIW